MSPTKEPKRRKVRKHATGISAPCRLGRHSQCTMLECEDACHSTEEAADIFSERATRLGLTSIE